MLPLCLGRRPTNSRRPVSPDVSSRSLRHDRSVRATCQHVRSQHSRKPHRLASVECSHADSAGELNGWLENTLHTFLRPNLALLAPSTIAAETSSLILVMNMISRSSGSRRIDQPTDDGRRRLCGFLRADRDMRTFFGQALLEPCQWRALGVGGDWFVPPHLTSRNRMW